MESNNEQRNIDSLREKIMGRIKNERISMRPRVYFTLHIAALAIVSFLVLAVSVFIFNFILFSLRINSHEAFLSFGPRGFVAFLTFFPWTFLAADIVLIFLLEWLLRTFKFGYRLPILYVLGGILLVTLVSGFALDRGTGFNDQLLERAEAEIAEYHLPEPFESLYGGARRPPHDGVCHCVITAIGNGMLTVEDYRHGATTTFTIMLPENDPRATSSTLKVGDWVMIAGDHDGDAIRAFGVHGEGPYEHRNKNQ